MPSIRKANARIVQGTTKDLGDGVVSVIVSTNTKDRHGEIVNVDGIDTTEYSGVVLLNHDYEQLPIGKSISLTKENGKLISKTQFAINEFPLAATVYNLVKGGYMPDVSIGFIPEEFDASTNTWTKSKMIEYSHVAIGANPDAKVQKALDNLGLSPDDFTQQVKEHMTQVKNLMSDADKPKPEVKGEIQDELDEEAAWEQKYANVRPLMDIWWAFLDVYYSPDTPVDDFGTLVAELIGLFQQVNEGTFTDPVNDPAASAPIVLALKKGVDPTHIADLMARELKQLDIDAVSVDNVFKHLATLKRLATLAEAELATASKQKDGTPQTEQKKKRVVTLKSARSNIKSIDKVAELVAIEIKKKLREEQ